MYNVECRMHNFGSPADLDYMLRVAIGNDRTMHNVECIMSQTKIIR